MRNSSMSPSNDSGKVPTTPEVSPTHRSSSPGVKSPMPPDTPAEWTSTPSAYTRSRPAELQ